MAWDYGGYGYTADCMQEINKLQGNSLLQGVSVINIYGTTIGKGSHVGSRCCRASSEHWRKLYGHTDWQWKAWFPHSFCARAICGHMLVPDHHDFRLLIHSDSDHLKGSSFGGNYGEALQRRPFTFPVVLCRVDWESINERMAVKDSVPPHPLGSRMFCFSGNSFFLSSAGRAKDLGSPQRLPGQLYAPVRMHCPLFGSEVEGQHFFLLSLVYVIDARTSNFRDT